MPDPSLERYLAEHYYSGPKSEAILKRYGDDGGRKKKKRRKHAESTDTLTIRDENSVWFGEEPDAEDTDEAVVPETTADMHSIPVQGGSMKSQGWVNLRASDPSASSAPRNEQATPDDPHMAEPADTTPDTLQQVQTAHSDVHVVEPPREPEPPRVKAGLMTGAQLRAQREAREAAERAGQAREQAESAAAASDHAAQQETVYRDASGRRIDIAEEEARIREEQARIERKERERKQWNQGLVQRREREASRNELAAMQKEGVTRHAEDAKMNEVLREKTHWDDPALAFLTRRSGPRVRRPQYDGPPPPPNRFNIKPGYRWDGVDRGNGFESRLFLKINSNQRLQSEFQVVSLHLGIRHIFPPSPPSRLHIHRSPGMSSLTLALPLVSPLVTRVLELKDFPPELQTRDIHTLLAPSTGGDESTYKIKWRDDTSAYIIFQDPGMAKRAYLQLLCTPPALLRKYDTGSSHEPISRLLDIEHASIRPCTGQEVATLLGNVLSHPSGGRVGSGGNFRRISWGANEHNTTPSLSFSRHFSGEAPGAHRRIPSNALPSKPIGSLDASGSLSRAPGRPEFPPRSPNHSRMPSGGAHAVDPSALRMI